jgi:hypothetical protein
MKLKVSATCGHSFCGECIFEIFEQNHLKIKCPLCRKEIAMVFKLFNDVGPSADVEKVINNIREYNRMFDDNRPIMRRIV